MGMSSGRPLLSLWEAVPSRGCRDCNLVTAGRRTPIALSTTEDVARTVRAQRMPSKRPIDRRWNRSRSIAVHNARRNVLRDFRWATDDPIIFSKSLGGTRDYASRSIGRSQQPPPQQQKPSPQQVPRSSSTHNVLAMPSINTNDVLRKQLKDSEELAKSLRQQIAQNNKALTEAQQQRQALERRIDEMNKAHQAKLEEVETKRRAEAKRLEKKEADLETRLEQAVHKAVSARNAELDKRQEALHSDRNRLEGDVAALDRDRAQLDSLKKEAREQEKARYQDLLRLPEEHLRKAVALMEDAAESTVTHLEDRAKLSERLVEYRGRNGRQDYYQYQNLWSNFRSSAKESGDSQYDVNHQLFQRMEAWEDAAAKFSASKLHKRLSSKYPGLTREIESLFASARTQAAGDLYRADESKIAIDSGPRQSLSSLGHWSRLLTRFHRFHDSPANMTLSNHIYGVMSEAPLGLEVDKLSKEQKELRLKLKHSPRDSDEARLQEVNASISRLKAARAWLRRFKTVEGLKVLRRHDSDMEKEVYIGTMEVFNSFDQAVRTWNDFTNENRYLVEESGIDQDDQRRDREEILRLERAWRDEFKGLESSIRERHLLRAKLGEADRADTMFDAVIDAKIRKAELGESDDLRDFVGLPTIRSSSFRSPLESTRSADRSRTEVPWSRATLRRMRARSRANEQAKSCATTEREENEHVDGQTVSTKSQTRDRLEGRQQALQLLKSRRERHSAASQPDDKKLERINFEIRNLEKKLSRSSLQPTNRRKVRERRHASTTKLEQDKESSNMDRSSSPSANQDDVGGSRLNLTPTAPKQSWKPLAQYISSETAVNGISSTSKSPRSHGAMLHKLLDPTGNSIITPRALHVYSLHSLETSRDHEQTYEAALQDSAAASNSNSPGMHALAGSYDLSQSTAAAISDPESDNSYEPSDSEESAFSDDEGSLQRQSDSDALHSTASTQDVGGSQGLPNSTSTTSDDPANDHIDNLTYKISAEDYRRAATASENTNTAFWTYRLYKNDANECPKIHYCTSFETAEAQAKQFLEEPVLGFDLEWEFGAAPSKSSSIKSCVSLVQIASESKVGLFQLAMFKGDTAEQLMPPSLRKILESRDIVKAGVNVSGDAGRIEKCFGFKMQGLFELSHLYNVVTWSESKPERVNKKLFKLADQVQNVLLLPMKKDAVRVSAWSKRLKFEQTEYAASDAYAGLQLYYALEARRKKMDPTPPRPAFWEDRNPLVLGDGTVVIAKRVTRKKPAQDGRAAEDDEDDECEEYFDAMETLDPPEPNSSSTAGIPLQGLSISYPTLPPSETTNSEPQPPTNQESSTALAHEQPIPASAPKPSPTTASSPAFRQADDWAQTFRNSLPATHNLKSKQATLRAYHLWHHQNMECKEVASVLRDPPLSIMTVASYVLQALSEGSELECDKNRVAATLEIIPASARGRYWRVLERVERAQIEREVGRTAG